MKKDYNIEQLWVVHKGNNIREAYICKKTDNGFQEIFSGSTLNLDEGKYYLTLLSKYYDRLIRMFYVYQDLPSLMEKFNEINNLDFIRFYDSKNNYKYFKFINEPVKWYKYELLKWYYLCNLYIIDNNYIHLCRYNMFSNNYVDIFTSENINGKSILLTDYLKINNIECNYQRLNIYSLLRLSIQVNMVNNFIRHDNIDEIVIEKLKNK